MERKEAKLRKPSLSSKESFTCDIYENYRYYVICMLVTNVSFTSSKVVEKEAKPRAGRTRRRRQIVLS